uniref:(California timema) hypothetical protein n=1 Tax=Timema californicum TaxID=61474 RepID=A0A7R9JNB7_TIMCA|nr:unnamed protein product [Timema californicum]
MNKVRKLLRIYPEHHPNLPSSPGDLGAFLGPGGTGQGPPCGVVSLTITPVCISVGDCILFYEYMHGDYRVHLDLKVLAANPG